jgi:hypothetical protein
MSLRRFQSKDRLIGDGDVRFVGGKYPNLWFMAANHLMTGAAILALFGVKSTR